MTKIADLETAQQARATHEALVFLRGSALGARIETLLTKVESDAISRAMHGKTPQDQNVYMESRGRLAVTRELKDLFADIEAANDEALAFIAADNATRNQDK
jgi:hypothetical protein